MNYDKDIEVLEDMNMNVVEGAVREITPEREQALNNAIQLLKEHKEEWVRKQPKSDKINYDSTVSSMASQIGIDLWKAMEMMKYAKHRFKKDWVKKDSLPRIVCLCGSTRFVGKMACIAWALERDEGYIVLGLHLLPSNYPDVQPDHMAEHVGKKEHFDELHKRKIDLADEVFIVNIGGYIGESTRSEIEYATKLGKPIKYLEKLSTKE